MENMVIDGDFEKKEVEKGKEKVQQDILSWDLDSVMARSPQDKLSKIPNQFENLEQYSKTFWRLMHEELRAHIQQVSVFWTK